MDHIYLKVPIFWKHCGSLDVNFTIAGVNVKGSLEWSGPRQAGQACSRSPRIQYALFCGSGLNNYVALQHHDRKKGKTTEYQVSHEVPRGESAEIWSNTQLRKREDLGTDKGLGTYAYTPCTSAPACPSPAVSNLSSASGTSTASASTCASIASTAASSIVSQPVTSRAQSQQTAATAQPATSVQNATAIGVPRIVLPALATRPHLPSTTTSAPSRPNPVPAVVAASASVRPVRPSQGQSAAPLVPQPTSLRGAPDTARATVVIDMTNIIVGGKEILRQRDPRFRLRCSRSGAINDKQLSNEVKDAFWEGLNINRFIKVIESVSWSADWKGKINQRVLATGAENIPSEKVAEFEVSLTLNETRQSCPRCCPTPTVKRIPGLAAEARHCRWKADRVALQQEPNMLKADLTILPGLALIRDVLTN